MNYSTAVIVLSSAEVIVQPQSGVLSRTQSGITYDPDQRGTHDTFVFVVQHAVFGVAVVVIIALGCSQASQTSQGSTQALADLTGRTVFGNDGDISRETGSRLTPVPANFAALQKGK